MKRKAKGRCVICHGTGRVDCFSCCGKGKENNFSLCFSTSYVSYDWLLFFCDIWLKGGLIVWMWKCFQKENGLNGKYFEDKRCSWGFVSLCYLIQEPKKVKDFCFGCFGHRCKSCGGSGLSDCSRCLGTGEYRYIMGFRFLNQNDDGDPQLWFAETLNHVLASFCICSMMRLKTCLVMYMVCSWLVDIVCSLQGHHVASEEKSPHLVSFEAYIAKWLYLGFCTN